MHPRPPSVSDTRSHISYQPGDNSKVCSDSIRERRLTQFDPDTLAVVPTHPPAAVNRVRRKLDFWYTGAPAEGLQGARLIINGTEVDICKQEPTEPQGVNHKRDTISSSSLREKTFDDNNNSSSLKIANRNKKDGYAEFVKRQSLERHIFSDNEIDYSLDIGRAAASQLLSSDSEESVCEDLVINLKKELYNLENTGRKASFDNTGAKNQSKTAPILENQNEQKKKVGGFRRLLSPSLFSGDRRKSFDHASNRTTTPVHDNSENKTKAMLETAFIGGDKRAFARSKSVSPSRITQSQMSPQEIRGHPVYGVPKTNIIRAQINGSRYYCDNGNAPNCNANADKNKNLTMDQRPPNLGPLKVDTNNRRDSVASSTSSSSTLVSGQDVTPPWVRDINRNLNNAQAKTLSLPGYRNPPQASPQQQRSYIPVNQSGRVSAPPYIDCCTPYGQVSQDSLLMPVGAQLKITQSPTKQSKKNPSQVSQQIRGLLSPQILRPRGFDPYYCNQHNHSSSLESSPGSQNSPKELRQFNPNMSPSSNPNLVKPQPIYNSTPRRPRSVSPASGRPGNLPPEYFVRGSNQRNTFSGGRPARQSIIYEEVIEEGKELKQKETNGNPTYGPIFKRGSLQPSSSCEGDLNSSAGKRVSFSPSQEQDMRSGEIYWPTRKGMAPDPPTRQSTRVDQTDYVNVSDLRRAPDRPLPPIPRKPAQKQDNVEYGVVGRQRGANTPTTQRVQALASRWQQQLSDNSTAGSQSRTVQAVPSAANRWICQSDTESGSEAGEIQRILQADNFCSGNVYKH